MLSDFLNKSEPTKFILIEDSLSERGKQIENYLQKSIGRRCNARIHLFLFNGILAKIKAESINSNVTIYDFVSNPSSWVKILNEETFESASKKLSSNDVIVIDSLVHFIYLYGLGESYRMLNHLKSSKNFSCKTLIKSTFVGVLQIITTVHTDLVESQKDLNIFSHLSTLRLKLEPKFNKYKRIQYCFKKSSSKVINKLEEYSLENDTLTSYEIEKLNINEMIQPTLNPESLASFRINLNEDEKKSRDELILPFTLKAEDRQSEGEIIYKLEDIDDWDEEDPDDDLDI